VLETALQLLVLGGALKNDAQLVTDPQSPGDYLVLGDPTEGALVSAAANLGLTKPMLEVTFPRVGEVPFSSERKRMSTIHHFGPQAELYKPLFSRIGAGETNTHLTFTKGAVDAMLEICDRVYVDNQVVDLDSYWNERIERASESMAADGLRVLGLGYKLLPSGKNIKIDEQIEQGLVFIGLYGMMDPPRTEALDAVKISQAAGIRTIMITGDHPLTAERIAREVGIAGDGHTITGQKLDSLSDNELLDLVTHTNVFARVAPEHKLRIVSALQARGEIVAMTGDGVNDAPALRKANIGVAMGITGTDVSKEASDMVLLDDNFATIVSAVREGRTIFSNIRKFIKYTMTSNAGEIIVMLLAPIFGLPLPLTALQILWINLVTDGFPGLALSTEPTEQDTMERPPIDPAARILSGGLGWHIILVGLLMGLVSLGIGIWAWSNDNPAWTTMVFTTLTLSQMGHVLAIRSDYRSLFEQGLFSNKPMLAAVMTTFGLQMLITYWKPMNEIFETIPLSPQELAISLSLSMVVFLAVEVEKSFKRRKRARDSH
jgi:Ca2+-transporting ATPase